MTTAISNDDIRLWIILGGHDQAMTYLKGKAREAAQAGLEVEFKRVYQTVRVTYPDGVVVRYMRITKGDHLRGLNGPADIIEVEGVQPPPSELESIRHHLAIVNAVSGGPRR